jgi:hypothetical protein
MRRAVADELAKSFWIFGMQRISQQPSTCLRKILCIVYEDVPFGQVSRGAEEFKTFAEGFFTLLPQSTFTLVKSSCSGQHGSIEWRWKAEDNPGFFGTGDQFDVRGVSVIAIHGNRISRTSDYWDYATVLRHLGQLQ